MNMIYKSVDQLIGKHHFLELSEFRKGAGP